MFLCFELVHSAEPADDAASEEAVEETATEETLKVAYSVQSLDNGILLLLLMVLKNTQKFRNGS